MREGEPLFHEGTLADAIHSVRIGTFKAFRTTEDGHEQVLAFANRAELLGFDAVYTGCHPASCVALEESGVYAMPCQRETCSSWESVCRRSIAPFAWPSAASAFVGVNWRI